MIETFIRRPVFTTMFILVLIVFGIRSYPGLGVDLYPDVDLPMVGVTVTYEGTAPEEMETLVTKPIENRVSQVSGIKTITSTIREGYSQTVLEFEIGTDPRQMASEVREKVAGVRRRLPDDIDEPVVSRDSGDGEVVLWLNLSSTVMDRVELSDYARNVLEKNLSLADGVSQIELVGALEKVMYVRLIPQKMASMGITVDDIVKALGNENIELPSGEIRNQDMVFPVQLKKVYVDNSVFELLPVRHQGIEKTIRLRDVANIEIKAKNEESIYRRNGISSIGIGVIPQSNANPLDVAMNIRDQVMVLKKNLPEDLILDVDYDSTVYISNSIREVYETLGITVILVIIVLYLFIGTVSTTLIPAVTVPVSVIASFIGAYFLGFSINIITLLSLILAIGLVVDDAIVMVENISFHIKKGEGVLAACWNGAREVGFAIVATSVVLIIIFLPLMFMQGLIGKMFIEFAVLLSFAVFFSSFIALTLSPALCSWLLKPSKGKSEKNLSYFLDYIIGLVEVFYEKILRQILKRLYIYPAVIMAVTGIMVILYQTIPHQLSPKEDRGVVYIYALGSEGASIHRMKRSMLDLE